MKQLSLFNHGLNDDKKDLTIFNGDIVMEQEYPNEPCLVKKNPPHLLEHHYVRTRNNNTYYIDGLSRPQKVFAGYEIKKNYKGEKYRKEVFKLQERGYSYIYKDGKNIKEIVRHEDIVAQSPFLIDLCFKNDYVVTKEFGTLIVEHKEIKRQIEVEKFNINGYTGENEKKKIKYPKSFLICNHGKSVLYEKDLIGLIPNPSFDYQKYLEKGMKIKCDYWGWCIIDKVMSGKVLCTNDRASKPLFIYFNQITDIIDD